MLSLMSGLRLVSQRTAAAILGAAECCNEPQSRLLMHAGVCGPGWPVFDDTDPQTLSTLLASDAPESLLDSGDHETKDGERETRTWSLAEVVRIAQRPRLSPEDLAAALPGDIAVVVRQTSRQDLPPGTSEANPVNRTFYGLDAAVARSHADTEQRDASRMLWRVSPARRRVILDAVQAHGGVPLLASCAGYLVTGWTIVGFDDKITEGLETAAFALADGEPTWRTHVTERWFNSGPGQPLAFIDLRKVRTRHSTPSPTEAASPTGTATPASARSLSA